MEEHRGGKTVAMTYTVYPHRKSIDSAWQGAWWSVIQGHSCFLLPFFHFSGEDEAKVGSQFLTGCLEKIQVQGRDLDLDLAVKHMSISSHSCPA